MKLWLTLVFGTVAISASMTYLVMHQGGQTLPDAVPLDVEFSTPSKAEFGRGQIEGNVLFIDVGKSALGKQSTLTIPIKCIASTPLKLELLRISCSCVHPVTFGGTELLEKKPATLNAGETAELKIRWTPKEAQAKTPKYRFTIFFLTNDPQYSPTFRIEVEMQVLPDEGTK